MLIVYRVNCINGKFYRQILTTKTQRHKDGQARPHVLLIKMDNREIITKVADKIKTQYQPQRIILFGSYAWGNPTQESDLDLLIVKETRERYTRRTLKIREILTEENGLIGMDILVYTPKELSKRLEIGDSFLSKILEEGEVLYAKE